MFNPVSTYRIQFHKDFTFGHLEQIIPYLVELGIKTLYASPIFKAVPGSNHGYDNVDPLTINPEIGTVDQLKKISQKLKANKIAWLQDIVPNHMAFHQDNLWLMDLLEKGPDSDYKNYFDQSLADNSLFEGPIMVPFLGDDIETVIASGDLKLDFRNGKLVFAYADQIWPVNTSGYSMLFETLKANGSPENITDVAALWEADQDKINGDTSLLLKVLQCQYYRLCSWKETDQQINYRRFFTVNGLICLNIQREEVFEHVHQLIGDLVKDGTFQGLRIDHIDGLYDPAQYLQRLRAMAGPDAYIVVEKILEANEELPPLWPIQGSTGYYFLSIVNNLFTNRQSEKAFTEFYSELTGKEKPVQRQVHSKKSLILSEHMGGELDNLTRLFNNLDLADVPVDNDLLKEAIGAFLIEFPVYRFYGNSFPLNNEEVAGLETIFNSITKRRPDLSEAIKTLAGVLIEKPAMEDLAYNERALKFYQRCMQFTGPLMAKGVEDTLMYTYNRFIDHNEVGDSPDAFGLSVDEFHQAMQLRQQKWPLALNATATHDTKRGEGVRARLNVLSCIPDEWIATVRKWQALNNGVKHDHAPDANDEYFIYQTLTGAYPMPGQEDDDFAARLDEYMEKVLREAKRHSNWAEPNEAYENGVKSFAAKLQDKTRPFWSEFTAFHQKISDLGIVNSLAQVTLKLTCPGVPDVYQGTELWDLSLVDPDNRRAVDYQLRDSLLSSDHSIQQLWNDRFNGQIKAWTVQRLLLLRKKHPNLFAKGDYLPLPVKGDFKARVMAFARIYKGTWIVVIIPLNVASYYDGLPAIDWLNNRIPLPGHAPAEWENMLTGETGKHQKSLLLTDALQQLPYAVLKLAHPKSTRSSGVLMHITSLPSNFGIGDLGPQARAFADLLHKGSQQYWQILPLNVTSAADGHSPYSSNSSHAGNVLLISPELLADEGLLTADELESAFITDSNRVNFKDVEKIKTHLLNTAWNNFKGRTDNILRAPFDEFCAAQAFWLDDYALYAVIKQKHDNTPWAEWPRELKFRDQQALDAFSVKHSDEIQKAKWLQYLFASQWRSFKTYCNQLNIRLFGDLPFYISYDSVDVWANPQLFSLDEHLEPESVCGVPPDYFNADGQRWGMPVFKWGTLKASGYDWWLKRIRKNLEWYDLLRLDHFRAFAAYWEIPASELTAVNGKWVTGPGNDFFNALVKEFGKLPFVAEDLGDIDEDVYKLRDDFKLPGMKVLQFAFGDDLPQSAYAPHHHGKNYFVYTGTHDNNTTLGWYNEDAGKTEKHNLKVYTGVDVSSKNINKVLIKAAFASVCKTAIVPAQDWLDLDETARMNTPAGEGENWTWRLTREQMADIPVKKMRKWTLLYDRG
ncbi:malto-oligosyltrehalose synthase [Mucilaginibacter sp.]|uniref:malto-oligosyltrehalose synthase n=1 Tax=Mucilaginibacter sp. TaxID=1882438 RepID=UPI0035BC84CB